uniref:Uncharacterized protein n=1 Tax=Erpetoichthys calabaricus TaxID=27687 RepID=A0A8C4RPX0_ERPCA
DSVHDVAWPLLSWWSHLSLVSLCYPHREEPESKPQIFHSLLTVKRQHYHCATRQRMQLKNSPRSILFSLLFGQLCRSGSVHSSIHNYMWK